MKPRVKGGQELGNYFSVFDSDVGDVSGFLCPNLSVYKCLEWLRDNTSDETKHDTKQTATVYDISDDLSYKGKPNFTLNHFKERVNIYNREGFNYEIHTVDLK